MVSSEKRPLVKNIKINLLQSPSNLDNYISCLKDTKKNETIEVLLKFISIVAPTYQKFSELRGYLIQTELKDSLLLLQSLICKRYPLSSGDWVNMSILSHNIHMRYPSQGYLKKALVINPILRGLSPNFKFENLPELYGKENHIIFYLMLVKGQLSKETLLQWGFKFKQLNNPKLVNRILNLQKIRNWDDSKFLPIKIWSLIESRSFEKIGPLITAFVNQKSKDIVTWNNIGLEIQKIGQVRQTLKYFLLADRQFKINPDITHNCAQAAFDGEQFDLATQKLRKNLVLHPKYKKSWSLLSIYLGLVDKINEAVEAVNKSLIISPNWPPALVNKGLHLAQRGDASNAISNFKNAIQMSETVYPQALYNLALAQISVGDIKEGFENYQWRWFADGFTAKKRNFGKKQWMGPKGSKKDSLAIYMEQGIGDEVMYSWYFNFLQKDTTDLIIECDRRLIPIFERTFPLLKFEAREENVGPRIIDGLYQYECAIGDVPRYYVEPLEALIGASAKEGGPQSDSLPSLLKVNSRKTTYWRQYLENACENRPCFGVFWRSKIDFANRSKNYVSPSLIGKCIPFGSVVVNLQYEHSQEEDNYLKDIAKNYGFKVVDLPEINLTNDIDDLFSVLKVVDAVIGPLLSTSWFAAAVGTPAYTFRKEEKGYIWQQFGTKSIVWAPAIRMYFSRPSDPWENTMSLIQSDLLQKFGR